MTYYDDLQIPKTASLDEIKRAYRKLAVQHHPDKGGDVELFQKIQAAYETLSDPQRKEQYDVSLQPNTGFPFLFDLNVLFSKMNINFNRPRKQLPDEHITVKIPFKDALHGFERTLQRNLNMRCEDCLEVCPKCNGQGYVMHPTSNGLLSTASQLVCKECNQRGLVHKPRDNCSCFSGMIHKQIRLFAKVDKWNVTNASIRFDGLGKQPSTYLENASHFFINFEVDMGHPDLSYNKQGNITFSPTLSFADMICGCSVDLPSTLTETHQAIQIPPLSVKPGYQQVLKGLGFFRNDKEERGDLVFVPNVDYNVREQDVDLGLLDRAFQR